ncbi:MAG: NAD(P)H-dependent oxidoreductase subunit E [Bacteroidota bacterium]
MDSVLPPILKHHGHDPSRLVQILREAQDHLTYIAPATVTYLAEALKIPRSQVESTLQFYAFLYDEPRGKFRILFSDNITDRMLGNRALFEHMLKRLKLKPGQVSEDGLVSVDLTSCTGMCDQGPALLVNNMPITRLTPRRIDEICDLVRSGLPVSDWPAHYFRVEDNIRRAEVLLGSSYRAGDALRAAVARGPVGMLAELKRSNLRGRGGAGFTTGVKWELCRNAQSDTRYIVCNADEGEPGTFKDRVLLQSFAVRVFEGMAIGGYTVGAKQGLVYLRAEYLYLYKPLLETLARMRANNLMGKNILGIDGFDFDIDIHIGAGAYVCGEETALIESLEGKAGRPRIRPPFPVVSGYMRKPTVVNNVETLCKVTEIACHGGSWYEALGTKQSTGTKILSVSGDCDRPGLYEFSFGVRVAEVLEECGARDPIAVQVSGASGTCLTPQEFRRRIAFEDVPTAGSFMVFGQGRDMFDMALNFAEFFAHESCGFCAPCRIGTALVKNMMHKIADGKGTEYELNEIARLRDLMRASAHCGLGQTAGNAIHDTVQKFQWSYVKRLASTDFVPSIDLEASLARAREVTGRDDADAHMGAEA